MATSKTYYNPDQESENSSSGEEDENNSERVSNIFSKWKKVEVANASDAYAWIGVQSERESRGGENKYKILIPGVIGFEYKQGKKEQEYISRIPWLRSQPHRYIHIENVKSCYIR